MEKFTLAMNRFKRNKYEECIKLCDEILNNNEADLSTKVLKACVLRKKNYVDHLEHVDEGLGDKV